MCLYVWRDDKTTYKSHTNIRKTPDIIFGTFGPPSSPPKKEIYRLPMSTITVTIAHIVKIVTLNPRSPAGTSKDFPC